MIFKHLGSLARPHHTLYVLGMYARSSAKSGSEAKVLDLDSCRVSWGKVLEGKRSNLSVERPALALSDGRLAPTDPERKEIHYDSRIPPFSTVRRGDRVSIHWNFASEKLLPYQLKNLKKYSGLDIDATNLLVSYSVQGRRR